MYLLSKMPFKPKNGVNTDPNSWTCLIFHAFAVVLLHLREARNRELREHSPSAKKYLNTPGQWAILIYCYYCYLYIYMLDIIIVFICFINQQTSRDWETHLAPVESVAPGSSVDHRRRFLASSCPFSWHVQKGSRPGAITKAAVENHHSHRFDFRKVSKTGSPL